MSTSDNGSKWGPVIIAAIKLLYDLLKDLIGRSKSQKENNVK